MEIEVKGPEFYIKGTLGTVFRWERSRLGLASHWPSSFSYGLCAVWELA